MPDSRAGQRIYDYPIAYCYVRKQRSAPNAILMGAGAQNAIFVDICQRDTGVNWNSSQCPKLEQFEQQNI